MGVGLGSDWILVELCATSCNLNEALLARHLSRVWCPTLSWTCAADVHLSGEGRGQFGLHWKHLSLLQGISHLKPTTTSGHCNGEFFSMFVLLERTSIKL